MFERPHHKRIAHVLASLNANLLARSHCLFGGGTAMALRHGEYRESVDIDFLVSDIDGYRHLRQLLTGTQGLGALARPGREIRQSTELRADHYGIRSSVLVGDTEIKFEIVLDRWADDSVFSRDIIDLAMMKPGASLLRQATIKASRAYGNSIDADLTRAAETLLARPGRLDRCMAVLQMTPPATPAVLRKRIKDLLPRAPHTSRPTD